MRHTAWQLGKAGSRSSSVEMYGRRFAKQNSKITVGKKRDKNVCIALQENATDEFYICGHVGNDLVSHLGTLD